MNSLEITDADIKDMTKCLRGIEPVSISRRGELMWKFDALVNYFNSLEENK